MSYLDLCSEYKKSRELFFKTHDDAAGFAINLYKGFKSHLSIAESEYDLIKLVPTIQFSEEDEGEYYSPINEDVSYTPHGAVRLDENGYWKFSILLRLHMDGNKNIQPAENIKFDISYKKVQDIIYFKYVQDKPDMQVNAQELISYLKESVYPEMENTVVEFYRCQVKFFQNDRSLERKIGLIP
ncbi:MULTISPECIES: hypothetical protein [unclassified Halobacteriovorax]|uniref:hypothetical protein n=1 Tax=unclassified Halobacteriovorax TaxID=2639665 RepID=UPI00399A232C